MRMNRAICLASLAAAAVSLAGCGSDEVSFRLNFQGKDRSARGADGGPLYSTERLGKINTAMAAVFGTPDDPFAWPEFGLDRRLVAAAAGPTGMPGERGKQLGLFREHCAHCHGVSGRGLGPTARFLNPYPRDFTLGIFKFTSTRSGDKLKPTIDDLKRTIREGIHGTAMPSFKIALTPREIDSVAEYVKYLAIRGEAEQTFFENIQEDTELTTELISEIAALIKDDIASAWEEAEGNVVVPEPREPRYTNEQLEESISKGKQLFHDAKKGNCFSCHGPTGMGDGPQEILGIWYDGKPTNRASIKEFPELYPLPMREMRPRNLRMGIFRGGRRKVDLYRRVSEGIKGVGMPGTPQLKPEERWNLVDYILSLPYEEVNQRPEPIAAGRDRQ